VDAAPHQQLRREDARLEQARHALRLPIQSGRSAANEQLLDDKGHRQECSKGPTDERRNGEAGRGGVGAPVDGVRGRQSVGKGKVDEIEGKGRREEGGRGVPHTGGDEGKGGKVAADADADVLSNGAVEAAFDEGGDEGEGDAEGEECGALCTNEYCVQA
jgi:hypothetical protein